MVEPGSTASASVAAKVVESDPVALTRAAILQSQVITETYDVDYRFKKNVGRQDIHTTWELVEAMREHKDIDISARLLCANRNGQRSLKRIDGREAFLSNWDTADKSFKESCFDTDGDWGGGGCVGSSDSLPYLGGPFYKQLYYYDYMRMHAAAFYAYHHDPFANLIIGVIRDFVLGRGYRVDCENPTALALWRAFEEANNLPELMELCAIELSIYGETMPWFLPNNDIDIVYKDGNQVPRKGLIPRVRLIDPSVIWEIVTYPEDIRRVLYYQWVAPTQYQIYTAPGVPSSKFIFQQIPAEQVLHFKVNAVSNEKRGRSDLFPVLGYLKRLRDTINYKMIGEQKNSAWSIDTAIEGNQADIDNYIAAMKALGTIPHAGSEFVHTSKVVRTYLANEGTARGAGSGGALEWCLSAIAAGSRVPVSYFGTHMSGGQTRASALVATEPVAKMFETRQLVLERILKRMARKVFEKFPGIVDPSTEIEVTFPDIITQDRSSKLKDLMLGEKMGWISKQHAATIAAKEYGITEFEYEEEKAQIDEEKAAAAPDLGLTLTPLTDEPQGQPSAITAQDRHDLDQNDGA